MADDHPLGLLALGSSVLAVVDPRRCNPLERARGQADDELGLGLLVESFLDVDLVETTALLAVLAAMTSDEVLRARIRHEVASRSHDLPAWLRGLDGLEVYRALEMVHVLGDGDNVLVGARLPSGDELTAIVYIDHNLGSIAKDAFVVPEAVDELASFMRAKTDGLDTTWNAIDGADARARITEAIDAGAITFPPFESDTWPLCRPLVEWVTAYLPPGGVGYERPDWDDEALEALADRFFASPFGRLLDDPDRRRLLDSLLWFGSGYGPGDPLRWSPVAVELLLVDWIPRKVVADAEFLSRAPELLRAFIGFCHGERGIRRALTDETLDAVDRWEPEYQEIVRSPRLQGPAALLAAFDEEEALRLATGGELELVQPRDVLLELLGRVVGRDALARLDARPLPDEPFAWVGIPADVHARVTEVLDLVDRCCDELFDVETRTACRRFLARVAAGDPAVFRRKGRAETAAAAVCWVVGKANDLFPWRPGAGVMVKDLMAHFGLRQGGVSQRAGAMLRAGGFDSDWAYTGTMDLGSPDYLVSSKRQWVLDHRDRLGGTTG